MPNEMTYLALILLAIVGASIGGAWLLQEKIGKRAYWFVPLPLVLLIAAGWIIDRTEEPGNFTPELEPAAKVSGYIRTLPANAHVGFSGAAFYKGKLYVTTNLGLLVIEGAQVTGIFRVQKGYSVVSGPWLDPADDLLWILDDQTGQFINFNGTVWRRVNTPRPAHGTYSRGDVLEGPKPVGNKSGFWMAFGGRVWQWDSAKASWSAEIQPSLYGKSPGYTQAIGVLPIGHQLLFLERGELLPFLHRDDGDFSSDFAVNGDGREIANDAGVKFLAETWAVGDDAAYICTQSGGVVSVTERAITKLDVPGKCETISSTAAGNAIAAFQGKGIYEYSKGWASRAPHPYASGDGEYWIYLAENAPQIAVAIEGKPVIDKNRSSDPVMQFTRNAPTQLWIYSDSKFHVIPLR